MAIKLAPSVLKQTFLHIKYLILGSWVGKTLQKECPVLQKTWNAFELHQAEFFQGPGLIYP